MKPSSPALLIGFEGGKSAPGAAPEEEGSGALAGKALKKALDGGDGQAIYDAAKALQKEIDAELGGDEDDHPDVAEPPTAA